MINLLIPAITGLLDKVIPDKDEAGRLAFEIATLAEKQAHESVMAQVEVNKTEANHKSVFVAGWRPFIGWICGFSLAYHFIIQPLSIFILAIAFPDESINLPAFDISALTTILMGMLGLGGLRTYEKLKGVDSAKK